MISRRAALTFIGASLATPQLLFRGYAAEAATTFRLIGPRRVFGSRNFSGNPLLAAVPSGGYVGTWVGGNGVANYRYYNTDGTTTEPRHEFERITRSIAPVANADSTVLLFRSVFSTINPPKFAFITAQRLGVDHQPINPDRIVSDQKFGHDEHVVCARLRSGNIAVFWNESNDGGYAVQVRGRLVSKVGAPVGTELKGFLSAYTADQLAGLAGGGFVLAFRAARLVNGTFAVAYLVQRYTAAGEKIGTPINLGVKNGSSGSVGVAGLPDGGFVAFLPVRTANQQIIRGYVFNAAGSQVRQIDGPVIGFDDVSAKVLALPDGRLIVVTAMDGGDFRALVALVFDRQGALIGGPFTIRGGTPFLSGSARALIRLRDGSFVCSFVETDDSGLNLPYRQHFAIT